MRLVAIAPVLLACKASSLSYLPPPAGTDARAGLGQLGDREARLLATEYRAQLGRAPEPAIRLVPTDGSELLLVSLAGAVTITGPLAHTELHLRFRNGEARVREGRFAIALPTDATVSRFAMTIDGAYREARALTRVQGREAYEQFLHRGVDPALLERDTGSQFSARIFPIGAREDKEVVIAYDHHVSARQPYTLPLRGLPELASLVITVDHDGEHRNIGSRGVAPDDVIVPIGGDDDAVAAGGAFAVRVTPPWPTEPAALDEVAVLVDTSASRAPVMARQCELVRQLLAKLPPATAVTVIAFDQAASELYRGHAGDAGPAIAALYEHGALGASDLGRALAAVRGTPRVVLVGDGAPTIGETDPQRLAARVAGIGRLDVVQIGTAIDRETLAPILRAGAQPGAILDGHDAERVVRQLQVALPAEQPIHIAGALAIWPATTGDAAPGDPIFVHGVVASDATIIEPLDVRIGDHALAIPTRAGDREQLRRAVASAEVAALTAQLEVTADPTPIAERIEQLALAHGLVSAQTSLIVEDTAQQSVSFSGATTLENTYIVDQPGALFEVGSGKPDPSELVRRAQASAFAFGESPEPTPRYAAPYAGTLREVMSALSAGERDRALELATRWQLASPNELAAVIGLGEALEARAASTLAARAYGSIIDLYPRRAELLRAAGERLERVAGGRPYAIDAYRRALRERPDQVTTYRLLAFALVRDGRPDDALAVLDDGCRRATRQSVLQILGEDAALIAAHLAAHDPGRRDELARRIRGPLPTRPSLRVVLSWETDANDVDLHVHDRSGGHAFYAQRELRSGGRLRDDLTDGFGPELFAVDDPGAFPYRVGAHYFSRGPMGIGLGIVQILRFDGANLSIEDRPFAIQNDNALVDLGTIRR